MVSGLRGHSACKAHRLHQPCIRAIARYNHRNMEYLNFNETLYSASGINSPTTDVLTIELRNLQDDSFNIPNSTTPPSNTSLDSRDETTNLPGLDYQNSERLVGIFFLIICTITGNITLIVALTYKRSRRIKRVNIFIVNLAISDLAVAFITMTSEILFIAFGEWVLGPVLCKISVYLEVVTLAAATFLLTAMSIDRYQVIVKPLESLTNRPKIWTKVTLAWCLAFIFAIPQTLIFRQVTEFDEKDGRHKHACKSKGYKDEWQRKLYFTFFTCYILIIPTIIMTFCYLKIMKVIWSRSETGSHGGIEKCNGKNPVSPRMSVNRNLVSSSRRKVVILTLTVIIGFLVCLTPYFVVSLVRIYSTYRIKLKDYLPATEMIFMLHSALNPILFGIFTFRLEHISCLVPKKCKSCFFNGLKDGVVDTPTSQWNDRNDVKLRLMASAKKHHHSIQSSTPQNALSCDLIRGKTENSLVCGESGKPLLYKPALKSALMIDRRENGNITLHVKAPSDPGTVDKSQRAAKNNYPPDYRSLFTQDRNLLTSEDYLKTGQGSAINTGHTCNDASREVKEYVSCV